MYLLKIIHTRNISGAICYVKVKPENYASYINKRSIRCWCSLWS